MRLTPQQIAERLVRELFNNIPMNDLSFEKQVAIQEELLKFTPELSKAIADYAGHEE